MREIKKDFLTPNPYSRCGKKLRGVKGVVIHWVGNPGTSAQANRNYFESLKEQTGSEGVRYASAHFVVGIDGEIIQCLPLDEWAYHVGAKIYVDGIQEKLGAIPNSCTIGIELCHLTWHGHFTNATWEAAAELPAVLLKRFNLCPGKDVSRHYDITGKVCPKWFVGSTLDWKLFLGDVEKNLLEII